MHADERRVSPLYRPCTTSEVCLTGFLDGIDNRFVWQWTAPSRSVSRGSNAIWGSKPLVRERQPNRSAQCSVKRRELKQLLLQLFSQQCRLFASQADNRHRRLWLASLYPRSAITAEPRRTPTHREPNHPDPNHHPPNPRNPN